MDFVDQQMTEELKRTLMAGSQSSAKIYLANVIETQVRMVNIFGNMADSRFISAIETLEDCLAPYITPEYIEEIGKLKEEEKVESSKLKVVRNPDDKKDIIYDMRWLMARRKYRALRRLMVMMGLDPPKDVVQDVI